MTAPKPYVSRRHLALRLRRLIGRWKIEGEYVGGTEVLREHGIATFRWLVKDALVELRMRTAVAPKSTSVLGADDTFNEFVMLYSDARGVVRRLEMTLTRNHWTLDRRAPGFHQRYIARISQNGTSIHAKWDKSTNGRQWLRDFNLTYTKLR